MQVQAGAIPFMIEEGVIKFLLVTTRNGKWIFPKGNIKNGFSSMATASDEAFEEAGVQGRVLSIEAGRYTYSKNNTKYEVILYPMEITAVLPYWRESSLRARIFGTYPLVLKKIGFRGIKKILKRFYKEIL